ncbi:MAG: UDP-N-acetylmuramoyl-L-alanine--D-glutamate ligase [Deltaproteobacteria bacterium]|nr:UDP-N-acetylmuramoyl-L-alanine--D-glutamate ligase [Deltaproteobacteria bacterium]
MEVVGRKFAVLGLARSGIACARLLLARGARVTVLDVKPREALPPGVDELERAGARVVLGPHPVAELKAAEFIVISPGIPDLPQVEAAEGAGVKVLAEIEVALWWLRAPIVAVTGTNGKSTVTSLLGEMGRRAGRPTFAGANLGTPLSDAVDSPANAPDGLVVAELSSFQFERTASLRPRVAVLLNVTDDHLDRHGTFEAYAELKGRVFDGQTAGDFAIVPAGDAVCEDLARRRKGRVLRFGPGGNAFVDGGDLAVRGPDGEEVRVPRSVLRIRGGHNEDNALAAMLAARCVGLPAAALREALATFAGLPHRMQLVAEVGGVAFYDDSKATNVGAALRAIEGLDRRGVLVAGGREKGGSYAPLRDAVRAHIKRIVLIGEARANMKAQLGDLVPCDEADTLEDAVRLAAAAAEPGEAVLLAPACSSWDMFRDYVERGDRFAAAAKATGNIREREVRAKDAKGETNAKSAKEAGKPGQPPAGGPDGR